MKSVSTTSMNQSQDCRRAFTIIELLVATAVTALLAGILLTMTNSVLNSWNRTSGSLSANSEAQLIFGLLKQDLQSAVFRYNHGVWMAVEVLDTETTIGGRGWTLPVGSHQMKPDGNLSQIRQSSGDRKSTRLNSSHVAISYAVFCLKKKRNHKLGTQTGPAAGRTADRRRRACGCPDTDRHTGVGGAVIMADLIELGDPRGRQPRRRR